MVRMFSNSHFVVPRGSSRTTFAPPIRQDELPRSSREWSARAGLTDPALIAARAHDLIQAVSA